MTLLMDKYDAMDYRMNFCEANLSEHLERNNNEHRDKNNGSNLRIDQHSILKNQSQ